MEIAMELGYDRKEQVRELFTEYTDMLVDNDPEFADYLKLQNYDEELEHLRDKYGTPGGRLYLLSVDGKIAGSIALKRLNEDECEIKRLYIRPAYRGKRLADGMVEKIIADARDIGYKRILLDTLPFLQTAIRMYRRLGFYEVGSYNNNPKDDLIYMRYDL